MWIWLLFHTVEKYTQLKLFPKNQTDGTSKIQLHNQLGESWSMEVFTNKLDFKFSDNQVKFSISKDGDEIAERCVEAGNARIGANE